MKSFSQTWLKFSGCNRIEPVILHDDNSFASQLKVVQTEYNRFDKQTTEIYRPQTFDILILTFNKEDKIFESSVVGNLTLVQKELVIDMPFLKDRSPADYDIAIILNSCDRGYGIFPLEDSTAYFIEKHLSDVFNEKKITNIQLMVILQSCFKMMQDGILPLSKLQVIFLHLL